MNFIMGILFIIMGGTMLIKPNAMWKISDSWKIRGNSSPTKFYLMLIRIGGCILLAGSILVIFEMR